MSKILTLYTGPGCHLCDQAREVILSVLPADWRLREVSIDQSAELRQRYGIRIPVVARDDGAEKGWPFTPGQIRRLVGD